MNATKFVVRLNRTGNRAPEYVQRVDPTPIQITKNRKRALIMGRLNAEDVMRSIHTSQCHPELVPVQVTVLNIGI
jgi:hypothetical protein